MRTGFGFSPYIIQKSLVFKQLFLFECQLVIVFAQTVRADIPITVRIGVHLGALEFDLALLAVVVHVHVRVPVSFGFGFKLVA
jgi:hypothetical protein